MVSVSIPRKFSIKGVVGIWNKVKLGFPTVIVNFCPMPQQHSIQTVKDAYFFNVSVYRKLTMPYLQQMTGNYIAASLCKLKIYDTKSRSPNRSLKNTSNSAYIRSLSIYRGAASVVNGDWQNSFWAFFVDRWLHNIKCSNELFIHTVTPTLGYLNHIWWMNNYISFLGVAVITFPYTYEYFGQSSLPRSMIRNVNFEHNNFVGDQPKIYSLISLWIRHTIHIPFNWFMSNTLFRQNCNIMGKEERRFGEWKYHREAVRTP